jgi:agmatinase
MRVFAVPYSNSHPGVNIARTGGTIDAPRAVRNLYEKYLKRNVLFLKENGLYANLVFADLRLSDFEDNIESFALSVFKRSLGERVAFLGGDHSITYYTFSAFRKYYGKRAALIALDAHPDLCRKGKEAPFHSDWLRRLLDDGFDPQRVLCIGWRDAERDELEFAKAHGIKVLDMAQIRSMGVSQVVNEVRRWAEEISEWQGYLTVDMDVADPSLVPAVTTPSPGGLDQHQMTELIKGLATLNIFAFDVVEIDPQRDFNNFSLLWVLKVLREMA